MQTPSLLVIFHNDLIEEYRSLNEYGKWQSLQDTYKRKEFSEKPIHEVITYYRSNKLNRYFYELQLRFYIIRFAVQKPINEFNELIHEWANEVLNETDDYSAFFLQALLMSDNRTKNKLIRYIYPSEQLQVYFEKWFDQSMTLELWKSYKYIQISSDFDFKEKFKYVNKALARDTVQHIKHLFNQYVEEIFQVKMKPRIKNAMLEHKERLILERLFNNTLSEDDKNYLARTFNISPKNSLSEDISKCLANNIKSTNIDIHSPNSFAVHYAIIKYYRILHNPKKEEKEKYAMWFKNMPTEKSEKDEVYERLKDIYDSIQEFCNSGKWQDFKNLFDERGSKSKIDWNEKDGKVLNFVFRKIGRNISYRGAKWDVISFFFNPHAKESLHPDKLKGNSHYYNRSLEEKINDLISHLTG